MFNYRSQFPVLMSPETLEKMERFIFVLELWDQISPSVQEFLGLVKIPLAPICYSMKTTDDEIYSLNFMADQFCMYPMIVTDASEPIPRRTIGTSSPQGWRCAFSKDAAEPANDGRLAA